MSDRKDTKRYDFKLRLQPLANSYGGGVLSYLNSLGLREYKELILYVLQVWFLPFALREKGDLTDEELRRIALQTCHALENRIIYIYQEFGLERPPQQTQQVVINNGQGSISPQPQLQQSQTPQQLPEQSQPQSPEQSSKSKSKKILSRGAVSTMAQAGEVFSMLDD